MENNLRKILLSFMLLSVTLFASLTNKYPTLEILNSNMPIVDIRTPEEWKETGIVKGAITIMFFNEKGAYNVNKFLTELNAKVDTTKPFALICRTGSRTKVISAFLAKQLGYNVTDLQGGMVYVKAMRLPIVPYKK